MSDDASDKKGEGHNMAPAKTKERKGPSQEFGLTCQATANHNDAVLHSSSSTQGSPSNQQQSDSKVQKCKSVKQTSRVRFPPSQTAAHSAKKAKAL